MTDKSPLTAERLRHLLDYDEDTGELTHRNPQSNRVKAGDTAGYISPAGYIRVGIQGKSYYAHQLAFLWKTGEWPENNVDHKDGDPSNNRWENLRPATQQENMWNRGPNRNNSTGHPGVSFHKRDGKFVARLKIDNKERHIGYFSTKEEAAAAREAAAQRLRGEFYRPPEAA